jgi:hypothetical protein
MQEEISRKKEALNFDDLKDYFIVLEKTNINLRKKNEEK